MIDGPNTESTTAMREALRFGVQPQSCHKSDKTKVDSVNIRRYLPVCEKIEGTEAECLSARGQLTAVKMCALELSKRLSWANLLTSSPMVSLCDFYFKKKELEVTFVCYPFFPCSFDKKLNE